MSLSGTYTSNIPQGTQAINTTQSPININFEDISELIAVNHTGFNTANTFGTHTVVDFVTQTTIPSTIASEIALYAANTSSNVLELYYRYANNGTSVQLTPVSTSSSTSVTNGNFYDTHGNPVYWTQFQNGVKMYQFIQQGPLYGSVPTPVSPYTFSFPTSSSAPAFTQTPFNIQASMQPGVNPASVGGFCYCVIPVSSTQFQLYYSGTVSGTSTSTNPLAMYVTAIGV